MYHLCQLCAAGAGADGAAVDAEQDLALRHILSFGFFMVTCALLGYEVQASTHLQLGAVLQGLVLTASAVDDKLDPAWAQGQSLPSNPQNPQP